jgi:hypothetical protein
MQREDAREEMIWLASKYLEVVSLDIFSENG